MKKLFSVLFLLFIGISACAQEITGDWYGELMVQDRIMGIVFHISETQDGYTTTLDSPAQNAFDIPVESTTFEDDVLEVKAPKLGGFHFKGKLKQEELSGLLRQGGALVPLKLSREKPEEVKEEAKKE
jgi:hypothetical protein